MTAKGSSRTVRLRQAFFPDADEDDGDARAGTGGCVHRLAGPSESLAFAIDLLLDYQADADAAIEAAGHLTELLAVTSPSTSTRGAATLAALLSRKQACRLAFADRPDLLAALLDRLILLDCESYGDGVSEEDIGVEDAEETLRLSAVALCHVSQSERGCLAIWRCGRLTGRSPTAALLSALTYPPALSHALTCLRRLLASVPESRHSARPGLALLAGLLGLADRRLLAAAADCLQLLAFGDSQTKRRLLELDVQSRLADLLRRPYSRNDDHAGEASASIDENLLVAAARLIRSLTVEPVGKSAAIRAGCFEALARHAASDGASQRLLLSCLWPLRNLSNCCCFDGPLASGSILKLLTRLTGLLASEDADTATCSAGLMCNLTCDSQPCKLAVVEAGGAVALTSALTASTAAAAVATGVREEFAEPLVCALRHVTRDHSLANKAAEEFFTHGGSAALHRLLNNGNGGTAICGMPLLKAILGLCHNLACLGNRWRAALIDSRLADAVAVALRRDADYFNPGQSSALVDADCDVSPEEVQEVGLTCLMALAPMPKSGSSTFAASAASRNLSFSAASPDFLAALASLMRSKRLSVATGAAELLDRLRLASASAAAAAVVASPKTISPSVSSALASSCDTVGRPRRNCHRPVDDRSHHRRPTSARSAGWEYCGVGHRRDTQNSSDKIINLSTLASLLKGQSSSFNSCTMRCCQTQQQRRQFAYSYRQQACGTATTLGNGH